VKGPGGEYIVGRLLVKKPTVFISYSHADSEFVDNLGERLKASGVVIWIDKWMVKIGDSITGKINEGIGTSDFLIIVLSRSSVESKWVREELNAALVRNVEQDKNAFILPVLKEDCEIPTILQHRRYANFKDDPEKGFQELIDVISPHRDIEPEMVHIPAGDFLMGSDPGLDKYAHEDEVPQHSVYVPEFYISKRPIINMLYQPFVLATHRNQPIGWKHGQYPDGKGDHPVAFVSWDDAVSYCGWLNEITGKPYRLPTEAEWEKAAKSTDGSVFPWGNEWAPNKCNTSESEIGDTTPVGQYSPQGDSPYGVADMAGNVWEWCADWYDGEEYKRRKGKEVIAPTGPKDGKYRVLRGGSWFYPPTSARCSFRSRHYPDLRFDGFGFRVVISTSDI
jgi:formylglycine-generating enzyme required for sulfatase activity